MRNGQHLHDLPGRGQGCFLQSEGPGHSIQAARLQQPEQGRAAGDRCRSASELELSPGPFPPAPGPAVLLRSALIGRRSTPPPPPPAGLAVPTQHRELAGGRAAFPSWVKEASRRAIPRLDSDATCPRAKPPSESWSTAGCLLPTRAWRRLPAPVGSPGSPAGTDTRPWRGGGAAKSSQRGISSPRLAWAASPGCAGGPPACPRGVRAAEEAGARRPPALPPSPAPLAPLQRSPWHEQGRSAWQPPKQKAACVSLGGGWGRGEGSVSAGCRGREIRTEPRDKSWASRHCRQEALGTKRPWFPPAARKPAEGGRPEVSESPLAEVNRPASFPRRRAKGSAAFVWQPKKGPRGPSGVRWLPRGLFSLSADEAGSAPPAPPITSLGAGGRVSHSRWQALRELLLGRPPRFATGQGQISGLNQEQPPPPQPRLATGAPL